MEHGTISILSSLFSHKREKKMKEKMIKELEEYPNDWFYMVKKNKDKDDKYWWWNKRTGEVSNKKPETFDRELTTFKSNALDSKEEKDDFKQEIIKDYGEWKYMKTTYAENEIKEWWWNSRTEECQFKFPNSIKEIIV